LRDSADIYHHRQLSRPRTLGKNKPFLSGFAVRVVRFFLTFSLESSVSATLKKTPKASQILII